MFWYKKSRTSRPSQVKLYHYDMNIAALLISIFIPYTLHKNMQSMVMNIKMFTAFLFWGHFLFARVATNFTPTTKKQFIINSDNPSKKVIGTTTYIGIIIRYLPLWGLTCLHSNATRISLKSHLHIWVCVFYYSK